MKFTLKRIDGQDLTVEGKGFRMTLLDRQFIIVAHRWPKHTGWCLSEATSGGRFPGFDPSLALNLDQVANEGKKFISDLLERVGPDEFIKTIDRFRAQYGATN